MVKQGVEIFPDDISGVVAPKEPKFTVKGKSWLVSNGRIVGLVEPSFQAPRGYDAILVPGKKRDQYPRISHDPKTDGQLIVESKTAGRVLVAAIRLASKKA